MITRKPNKSFPKKRKRRKPQDSTARRSNLPSTSSGMHFREYHHSRRQWWNSDRSGVQHTTIVYIYHPYPYYIGEIKRMVGNGAWNESKRIVHVGVGMCGVFCPLKKMVRVTSLPQTWRHLWSILYYTILYYKAPVDLEFGNSRSSNFKALKPVAKLKEKTYKECSNDHTTVSFIHL